MTGDTQGQIDDLRSALRQRVQLRILVRYADVYDLSAYSGRIEDVGEEKPYYSPYIAKRNADESWFPENLVPVVVWRPDGKSEPVAVPLHDTLRETLKTRAEDARAAGRDHIELPGFPRPMPVTEAEHIIQAFDAAVTATQGGNADQRQRQKTEKAPRAAEGPRAQGQHPGRRLRGNAP